MNESIDHSWICREDSGIERNQSFKERKTVTHNSVFAAHRLRCRMTNRKNRHPAFCCTNQELETQRKRYFSIRETCPAASCQRPLRLIIVSVNCTTRSNGLPSAVPFTRVFPRTTALSLP